MMEGRKEGLIERGAWKKQKKRKEKGEVKVIEKCNWDTYMI
jgi:hypothetical protein